MSWRVWVLAVLLFFVGIAVSVGSVWAFPRLAGLVGLAPASADVQAGSAIAMVFATYALIVVTALYVVLTNRVESATRAEAQASREMVDRMADSLRPLVVPVVSFEKVGLGKDDYVRIVNFSKVDASLPNSGQEWEPLFLQNIGCGPAINVGVVLKETTFESIENMKSAFNIPPGKGGARPIAAGGKEQAYQWVNGQDGHEIRVCEGSTLTITYDDMLGHHFQTTACRWLHDWYNIDTKPADTSAPPREYPTPIS